MNLFLISFFFFFSFLVLSKHRKTELRKTKSVKDEKTRERRKEHTQGVTESIKDETRRSSQDPWVYESVIERI